MREEAAGTVAAAECNVSLTVTLAAAKGATTFWGYLRHAACDVTLVKGCVTDRAGVQTIGHRLSSRPRI